MRWAVPQRPELEMELLGPLAESGRVAVGERARHRDQERSLEQSLPIVRLDHLAALISGPPGSALNRIGPTGTKAAAEVAPHEHMFA
jgi:hypothetical protein